MVTMESIIGTVDKLVKKYGTRDPYEICESMGICVEEKDLKGLIKGFFYLQSRIATIVVDCGLNDIMMRIIVAHELGHDILHKEVASLSGFRDMSLFQSAGSLENEANLFAAELLLDDDEVMEELKIYDAMGAASSLHVPPELLGYKLKLMKAKGIMEEKPTDTVRSDFLKSDLGAYDEPYQAWD